MMVTRIERTRMTCRAQEPSLTLLLLCLWTTIASATSSTLFFLLLETTTVIHAFVVSRDVWTPNNRLGRRREWKPCPNPNNPRFCDVVSWSKLSALPDISSMRVGQIRDELESYGISTKSFLEKKELVAALEKARAEGKQPSSSSTTTTTTTTASTSSKRQSSSSPNKTTQDKREERLREEMDKASKMSVADLKKELQSRGISTKSFFEKSEFVKAYAEAVVDGVGVNGNTASSGSQQQQQEDFYYDPEYRDVIMQKMNRRDPRLLQGTVIDIQLKR